MDPIQTLVVAAVIVGALGSIAMGFYRMYTSFSRLVVNGVENAIDRKLEEKFSPFETRVLGKLDNLGTDVATLKGWTMGFSAATGRKHPWPEEDRGL